MIVLIEWYMPFLVYYTNHREKSYNSLKLYLYLVKTGPFQYYIARTLLQSDELSRV
jgi:hypothetical protein